MKYKKGDLVKVIEVAGVDEELYGIIKGETYEVLYLCTDGNGVSINAGKGDRVMYNHQLKRVEKKKSKKDLRYWKNNCEEDKTGGPISVLRYITELENTIEQMKYILNK